MLQSIPHRHFYTSYFWGEVSQSDEIINFLPFRCPPPPLMIFWCGEFYLCFAEIIIINDRRIRGGNGLGNVTLTVDVGRGRRPPRFLASSFVAFYLSQVVQSSVLESVGHMWMMMLRNQGVINIGDDGWDDVIFDNRRHQSAITHK